MKHTVLVLMLLSLVLVTSVSAVAQPVALSPVATNNSIPLYNAIVAGGWHYFQITDYLEYALWRTDGTPERTQLLHEIEEGRLISVVGGDNLVYFLVEDNLWNLSLYVVDASDNPPLFLTTTSRSLPFGIVTSGDRCFWYFRMGDVGYLWTSDGTVSGTHEVRSFQYHPDLLTMYNREIAEAVPIAAVPGGVVLGAPHPEAGIELWFSDGTADGTVLFADLCHDPELPESMSYLLSSIPSFYYYKGNYAYFQVTGKFCDDPGSIYRTDGSTAGAMPSSPPGAIFNGDVFHTGFPGGLYRAIDGGPDSVRCEPPGIPLGIAWPYETIVAMDGYVYFMANTSAGAELWRTDGACDNVVMLADLNPGPADGAMVRIDYSNPELSHRNGYLYFYGNDGVYGCEVWRAGGNPVRMERLTDLNPGPGGIDTPWSPWLPVMVVLNDRLLFWGTDGIEGARLWALDLSGLPEAGCLDCPVDELKVLNAGSFALLTVPESIAPEGPFLWYYNGMPLSGGNWQGINTKTLTHPRVQPSQNGRYACKYGPSGEYYVIELEVSGAVPVTGIFGLCALSLLFVIFGLIFFHRPYRRHFSV